MFRSVLDGNGSTVGVMVDGVPRRARAGDTVASALLAAGHHSFRRSQVSGSARGPYCMMGVCFDCLVTINDIPNWQACLIPVVDGMRIATDSDSGAPSAADGRQ